MARVRTRLGSIARFRRARKQSVDNSHNSLGKSDGIGYRAIQRRGRLGAILLRKLAGCQNCCHDSKHAFAALVHSEDPIIFAFYSSVMAKRNLLRRSPFGTGGDHGGVSGRRKLRMGRERSSEVRRDITRLRFGRRLFQNASRIPICAAKGMPTVVPGPKKSPKAPAGNSSCFRLVTGTSWLQVGKSVQR
jgi:hypothetical protein